MTALVYVGTLLGAGSGQFYFNLGDTAILIGAALLNPISAMIAGGLGAFLGDLTVFPATMLFTLAIKAAEGLFAGILFKVIFTLTDRALDKLCPDKTMDEENGDAIAAKRKKINAIKICCCTIAAYLSSMIIVAGYYPVYVTLYGKEAAKLLPAWDALQATISATLAIIVLFAFKIERLRKNANR